MSIAILYLGEKIEEWFARIRRREKAWCKNSIATVSLSPVRTGKR